MSNTRELLCIEEGTVHDKWVDRVEEEVLHIAPNFRHTPLLLASTVKEILRTLRYNDVEFPEIMLPAAKDIVAINSHIGRPFASDSVSIATLADAALVPLPLVAVAVQE